MAALRLQGHHRRWDSRASLSFSRTGRAAPDRGRRWDWLQQRGRGPGQWCGPTRPLCHYGERRIVCCPPRITDTSNLWDAPSRHRAESCRSAVPSQRRRRGRKVGDSGRLSAAGNDLLKVRRASPVLLSRGASPCLPYSGTARPPILPGLFPHPSTPPNCQVEFITGSFAPGYSLSPWKHLVVLIHQHKELFLVTAILCSPASCLILPPTTPEAVIYSCPILFLPIRFFRLFNYFRHKSGQVNNLQVNYFFLSSLALFQFQDSISVFHALSKMVSYLLSTVRGQFLNILEHTR